MWSWNPGFLIPKGYLSEKLLRKVVFLVTVPSSFLPPSLHFTPTGLLSHCFTETALLKITNLAPTLTASAVH
jgi:hypothetical protein